MFSAYIFCLTIVFLSTSKYNLKSINSGYCSKDSSNAIKGLWILIIILSHFSYYYLDAAVEQADPSYIKIRAFLDQLVVVMFFFYSGFGICESVKAKNEKYIRTMPARRILKTLFTYDFSVIIFLIVSFAIGNALPIRSTILSFIALRSAGNDNWYIFDILLLYLMAFAGFNFYPNNLKKAAAIVTALVVVAIVVLKECNLPVWWYNTILCFPVGIWFSYYFEKISSWCKNHYGFYLIFVLAILAFVFLWGTGPQPSWKLEHYELAVLLFLAISLLLSMKISCKSKLLIFCGKNLSGIFLMHRLPMILLAGRGLVNNIYVCFIICLICGVLLGYLFNRVMNPFVEKIILQVEKISLEQENP